MPRPARQAKECSGGSRVSSVAGISDERSAFNDRDVLLRNSVNAALDSEPELYDTSIVRVLTSPNNSETYFAVSALRMRKLMMLFKLAKTCSHLSLLPRRTVRSAMACIARKHLMPAPPPLLSIWIN